MRLEEPPTPAPAHLLMTSPYLSTQQLKRTSFEVPSQIATQGQGQAALPLSLNGKLNLLSNVKANSRQAVRIMAMSNVYSSSRQGNRPNSLKQAIDQMHGRKTMQQTNQSNSSSISPKKALEMAIQEKKMVENRCKYLANE